MEHAGQLPAAASGYHRVRQHQESATGLFMLLVHAEAPLCTREDALSLCLPNLWRGRTPSIWMFLAGTCPSPVLHSDTSRNFAGSCVDTDPGAILYCLAAQIPPDWVYSIPIY